MANEVCPACFDGCCGECILNGCYCDCQLEELIGYPNEKEGLCDEVEP